MSTTEVRFSLWFVLMVIFVILGFFFITGISMEGRVAKCETSISYIVSNIEEVKVLVKDIRQDQIRRQEKEVK